MAILDYFEVTIDLSRSPTREYDDDELNTKAAESQIPTVEKYIEVKSGERFGIRMSLRQGYEFETVSNAIAWCFFVDGKYMAGRVTTEDDYIITGTSQKECDFVRSMCDGRWVMQHFKFQDLDITQENVGDAKSTMKKYGALGTIEVQAWRWYDRGYFSEDTSTKPTDFDKTVSEKALKGRAVTVGAELGEPIPCRASRQHNGVKIDRDPIAKFVFHYRTKKSLQDLLVIPTDDLEEMTAEQLRNIVRQKRTQATPAKETKPKIKHEIEIHDLDDGDEVVEVRARKRSKVTSTEVIEIDSD